MTDDKPMTFEEALDALQEFDPLQGCSDSAEKVQALIRLRAAHNHDVEAMGREEYERGLQVATELCEAREKQAIEAARREEREGCAVFATNAILARGKP